MGGNTSVAESPGTTAGSVADYLALLEQLRRIGALGKLVLYPAIGVDAFVCLFAQVLGLNLWAYDTPTLLAHLAPIIAPEMAARLRVETDRNLTYAGNVDITRISALRACLRPYFGVSPKSLLIKGLVESAFESEWDPDSERYYGVPVERAEARAAGWLKEVVSWLTSGDKVIVCDPLLVRHAGVVRDLQFVATVPTGNADEPMPIYSHGVPVIYLPRFATVFQRV